MKCIARMQSEVKDTVHNMQMCYSPRKNPEDYFPYKTVRGKKIKGFENHNSPNILFCFAENLICVHVNIQMLTCFARIDTINTNIKCVEANVQ